MLHGTTSSEALETHLRRSGEGLDIKQSGEFIHHRNHRHRGHRGPWSDRDHEAWSNRRGWRLLNITPIHGEEGGIHTWQYPSSWGPPDPLCWHWGGHQSSWHQGGASSGRICSFLHRSREGTRHTKNSVVEGLLILGELTVDGVGAGDIRGEALVLRHETQGRKHTSVPISQRTISPSSILRSLGAPTYQRTGRETYPRDRSGEWRCFCRYRRCQRRRRVCWRTCCSRRTSRGGEEAPNTLCMASSWNSYMPGLQEAMASRWAWAPALPAYL